MARTTPASASVLSPAAAAAAAGGGGGMEAAAAAARVTSALAELEAAAPGACAALLAGAIERLAGPAAGGEASVRGVRQRAHALFGGGGGRVGSGEGGEGGNLTGIGATGIGADTGAGTARSVLGDFLLARWQQDLKPAPASRSR